MYLKETIQKVDFINTILKLQHKMKKYTICDHYKFHLPFVTVTNSFVVSNLINVEISKMPFTTFLTPSSCAKSTNKLSASENFSIKHDLTKSCFQLWPKIGDMGDKISRKKPGEALAETVFSHVLY